VYAVAYSPDGRTVLTGSADCTARLWDAGTGQLLGAPFTHRGIVRAAAFSPTGQEVLTGSHDGTARLWHVATGKQLAQFSGHAAGVHAVAFSPNGQDVLTASADGTARLSGVPGPLPGGTDRIALWVSVLTGLELDETSGAVRVLDAATWEQRRTRLEALGGSTACPAWAWTHERKK
jgi:WD40 repeat protein